jgi:putative lipoic acid-binding regulatory protein
MRFPLHLLFLLSSLSSSAAWLSSSFLTGTVTDNSYSCSSSRGKQKHQRVLVQQRHAAKAGSFFNPVPEDSGNNNNNNDDDDGGDDSDTETTPPLDFDSSIMELIRQRKAPSLASQPSTVNGIPTTGLGFGKVAKVTPTPKDVKEKSSKPFTAIGPTLNDITRPEYDDQGYTLYANEETGQKSRVFEALVEYPCDFTMKIVGANEGTFVEEMVAVVAESCLVSISDVPHSVRTLGKWTSVTVHAPVQSAEMLYQLYENIDRDPRVKFKF